MKKQKVRREKVTLNERLFLRSSLTSKSIRSFVIQITREKAIEEEPKTCYLRFTNI